MMDKVTISAPGKLMLFGEHAVVYGRPCLVTALDARMMVKVALNKDKKIKIEAPEVGIIGYERDLSVQGSTLQKRKVEPYTKGIEFIESAIQAYSQRYSLLTGISVEVKNSFSSHYGLGSSSAITVCLIKALSEIFRIKLSKREIFDLAFQAVLDTQKIGSGFDVAAAVWGGTIFYQTREQKIIPLKTKQLPLVIVYSGIKADTPTMINKVQNLREKKFNFVEGIFDKISQLVKKSKIYLEKGDWSILGKLMNQNQKLLRFLGVSTPKIDKLVEACLAAGAWGAKLSGAGGGDCIITLVNPKIRTKVEKAVTKAGGIVLGVRPGAEGVGCCRGDS